MLIKTALDVFVASTPGQPYRPYSKSCPSPPAPPPPYTPPPATGCYVQYVLVNRVTGEQAGAQIPVGSSQALPHAGDNNWVIQSYRQVCP